MKPYSDSSDTTSLNMIAIWKMGSRMIEILMIKGFFEYVQIKKADDLDMAIKNK